jgi:hypothetical protein
MKRLSYRSERFVRSMAAAGLFALAFLMLLLSCPIKRVLQQRAADTWEFALKAGVGQKSTRNGAAYAVSVCCDGKKKTVVSSVNAAKHKITPQIAVIYSGQTGFGIHYFLSRLSTCSVEHFSAYQSLPLFLQHRRLLI